MKIAIIGLGPMGHRHLKAVKSLKTFDICLCDKKKLINKNLFFK